MHRGIRLTDDAGVRRRDGVRGTWQCSRAARWRCGAVAGRGSGQLAVDGGEARGSLTAFDDQPEGDEPECDRHQDRDEHHPPQRRASHRSSSRRDVAGPASGVDQRRVPVVDLPSQIADVQLDDVLGAVESVIPDLGEDLPFRDDDTTG